jgi:hypothetical protein
VIGIVEADANELADAANARSETRRSLDARQARGIDLAEAVEGMGQQRVTRNVGDERRQISP